MNKIIMVGIIVIILVAVVIGFTSFTGFSVFQGEPATIKIGVLVPLSGVASELGESLRDGIQLARDEVNSRGGIQGREIELIIRDTNTDANHVIWFTDRPAREAWTTSAGTLADGWSEQFSDSPPNADLQLFKGDGTWVTTVVTIKSSPIWNENAQTLTFNDACPILLIDGTTDGPSITIPDGTFSTAVIFVDGAKIGKWNSCYSRSDSGDDTCLEQWGSYPISCWNLDNVKYAPGKKCSQVCSSSSYSTGDSWNNYQSTYSCSN